MDKRYWGNKNWRENRKKGRKRVSMSVSKYGRSEEMHEMTAKADQLPITLYAIEFIKSS